MSGWKHAFTAVFWSFFGVRKHAEYEADTKRLKPQHVIAAGVVVCLMFVLVLFGIVKLVTR
jgi:diacylglycerol kinase